MLGASPPEDAAAGTEGAALWNAARATRNHPGPVFSPIGQAQLRPDPVCAAMFRLFGFASSQMALIVRASPHGTGDSSAAQVEARSERVGPAFVSLYSLSFAGGSLVLIAPLLVTLALKVNDLVGADQAASNLALVTGVGSLLSMVSNPLFGRLSDRTTARMGMRRPWMLLGLVAGSIGTLTVAVAPTIPVVLVGWCTTQVFFNALLAAQVAVLPDQVPVPQRGVVSGILGMSLPLAAVAGTYLVQAFNGIELAMFLAPCAVGGLFVVVFAARLNDRRLDPADRPPWSLREIAGTFYVNPRRNPDFAWAFASRFMVVMAYAFLVTYQAYYLLHALGRSEHDVPHQIYLGTLAQSVVLITVSPIAGRLSDRIGRRKVFVAVAAVIYAAALLIISTAHDLNGYFLGMAVSGLGFGMYMAVDLALVVDVLPDTGSTAKDLGVLNIAGALPFALAPALAPAILTFGRGSYTVLYAVAGACALLGAAAISPVKGVR
jgi:MFS family permease